MPNLFHLPNFSGDRAPRPTGSRIRSALRLIVLVLALFWSQAARPALSAEPLEDDAPGSFLPIVWRPGGPIATVASPDGTVKFTLNVSRPMQAQGLLRFGINHGGQPLVTSGRLGVTALAVQQGDGSTFPLLNAASEYAPYSITIRSVREVYSLAVSERSEIPNNFNEVTVGLQSIDGSNRRLLVVVRAYDEGVALRYIIPAQAGVARARYLADGTQFVFPAGTAGYEQRPISAGGHWTEGTYARVPVSQLQPALPMPLTLEYASGEYGAIFEAAVDNFARSSLTRITSPTGGVALKLEGVSESALPYASPWRVLMLAPDAGGLIERNYLLYNLAEPSDYPADMQALFADKPGTAMRIMGTPDPASPNDPSKVSYTQQQALDAVAFASARGIRYVAFDAGWYGNEYDPGSDPTEPQFGLDMKELAEFGATKNPPVGLILYVNQRQLNRNIDEIAGKYAGQGGWGISGIKLGFVEGTTQYGIEQVHYSVRALAEYGLFVDIHDEYRPSGLTRTYPNLFTQEGVAGAEQRLGAEHTTYLPFTRFIIGAADYTLPFYWAELPTTRGHQLGLAVIFYSPLNFVFWYDVPSQYPPTQDAAADFLASVPTTWDETHVLSGTPAESAAMARRKGEQWYVGAITNKTARTLPLVLDFLTPGVTYTARTYVESALNVFQVSEQTVTQGQTIQAAMLANGGFAMLLTPSP